jgi:hypothetical protein
MTEPIITIFSAPKPFTNPHISIIQRNAIQSWTHLGPEVDVLLLGDEPGMAEMAAACGVRHLPDVALSAAGTPLVSSMFSLARQVSPAPLLACLNADILLLPDFIRAARQVADQLQSFLVIGQRWDLDVRSLLDFSPGWEQRLGADLSARGRQHLPAGSDYFLFPRHIFTDIPDFAIGRSGWDNWMIYHARRQGWPVVDGTPSINIIHQDHDYSHLPGGKPHYEHPESQQNQSLAGGASNLYMVLDSDKQLIGGRVRSPRITYMRLIRGLEVAFTPPSGERSGLRWSLARQFRRLRRRLTGSL